MMWECSRVRGRVSGVEGDVLKRYIEKSAIHRACTQNGRVVIAWVRSCKYNSNFQFCLNLATAFLNGDGAEDGSGATDIIDNDLLCVPCVL